MKAIIIFIVSLCFTLSYSQNCDTDEFSLYKWEANERFKYFFVNHTNGLIKELSSKKYIVSLTTHINSHFAVFSLNNRKGWFAVDFNENVLFEVYNYIRYEPSPDFLTENRIRIINDENKIGFANKCGDMIIKPKFEWVTHFYNGKAIYGKDCSLKEQNDFKSHVCNKYGVINTKGETIKKYQGDSFDQIKKSINWKDERVFD